MCVCVHVGVCVYDYSYLNISGCDNIDPKFAKVIQKQRRDKVSNSVYSPDLLRVSVRFLFHAMILV